MKGNLHPDARAALMRGLEAIADARGQGRVPWLCELEGCDGSPHKGRRGPHARPNQRPPGDGVDWDTWLLLAGRGFGKTRTGAEWAIEQARKHGARRAGRPDRSRHARHPGGGGVGHPRVRPATLPARL